MGGKEGRRREKKKKGEGYEGGQDRGSRSETQKGRDWHFSSIHPSTYLTIYLSPSLAFKTLYCRHLLHVAIFSSLKKH